MSIPSTPAGLPATGAAKAPVAVEASPAQYLTFQLGGEMFAVGILNIKEIIEYGSVTEIPMVPPFIRGVINLRGAVVPVIDLASRFGGKRSEVSRRTCIVIIELAEGEERQDIGVVVDSVSEVLEIPASEIEPPPAFGARIRADFIKGMGKVNGRFVIILDVAKVLSVDEIASLSHLAGDATGDALAGSAGQA
ncbi:chemotaxis protein CheW [Zoogloea dura]|jgi:purine-binding chemotaxis protein CheW|uniref:Chemotaxis protein CheW n=1 Tax=Zoogloea dura TaxID=2728840 RepID=A0A848G5U3_9RHOO|nr:chemotaxis protein CheW [Zoogloea dura]NML26315.1 purine-binding chemotaxis protein CheW [Zoogloea dura]